MTEYVYGWEPCEKIPEMRMVQREEIVRCRDCDFSHEDELGNLRCHGPLIEPWDYYNDEPSDGVKVEHSGFCAWGVKRDEVTRHEIEPSLTASAPGLKGEWTHEALSEQYRDSHKWQKVRDYGVYLWETSRSSF